MRLGVTTKAYEPRCEDHCPDHHQHLALLFAVQQMVQRCYHKIRRAHTQLPTSTSNKHAGRRGVVGGGGGIQGQDRQSP